MGKGQDMWEWDMGMRDIGIGNTLGGTVASKWFSMW